MMIFDKEDIIFAYDSDLNEIVIRFIEDEVGDERVFVGTMREWKKYVQHRSVLVA